MPTKTFVQLGMNKLGKLEDIEEELGIDLITLFDILKNGCRDINGKFYGKVYLDVEEKELFEIVDNECIYSVSSLSQCSKKEQLL